LQDLQTFASSKENELGETDLEYLLRKFLIGQIKDDENQIEEFVKNLCKFI
jgi:hypothetical protein